MHVLQVEIAGHGLDDDAALCFDPALAMSRLASGFPELETDRRDRSRDLQVRLAEQAAGAAALRVAERDARRRGPIILFRLAVPGHAPIFGKAERYAVGIWSAEPLPEPLRSRFRRFIDALGTPPHLELRDEILA